MAMLSGYLKSFKGSKLQELVLLYILTDAACIRPDLKDRGPVPRSL